MSITIGEKIKELRKFHSITQNTLADYLNVTSQTVSKWENNVSMPDLILIPKIAKYFGITIDELFNYIKSDSREIQTEMYFQAIYQIVSLAVECRKNGILSLVSYIQQNEMNPLFYEGVNLMCDGWESEDVILYLNNKSKNEYMYTNENYIECIVTGLKSIHAGRNPNQLITLLFSYLPKDISREVIEKVQKQCEDILSENYSKQKNEDTVDILSEGCSDKISGNMNTDIFSEIYLADGSDADKWKTRVVINKLETKRVRYDNLIFAPNIPAVGVEIKHTGRNQGVNVFVFSQIDIMKIADIWLGGSGKVDEREKFNEMHESISGEFVLQLIRKSAPLRELLNAPTDNNKADRRIFRIEGDYKIRVSGAADEDTITSIKLQLIIFNELVIDEMFVISSFSK